MPVEAKYRARAVRAEDRLGIEHFCAKPHHDALFGLIVTQEEAGRIAPGVLAVPAKALLLIV